MFGLGKSKSVVGLDIGSSAVKAVELQAGRQGLRVAAFATEPVPPDSIVDGAIIDGAAVADAIRRLFDTRPSRPRKWPPRCRQRRHRQEDQPAGDDRAGARRIDLLGSRAVHPVRHPGRQPRLPDARSRHRRRRQGHDGSAARRREERQDRRLHRRHHAGRPRRRWSSTSTPSRCRTPTR